MQNMNTRLKVTIDVKCEEKGFHVCSNLTKDGIHPDELTMKEMLSVYVAIRQAGNDMSEKAKEQGIDLDAILTKKQSMTDKMLNWVMGDN